MHKNIKFGLIIVVILGTLGWLAAGGINQTASYYKEIAELEKLAPSEKVDQAPARGRGCRAQLDLPRRA